jgi:hypothetical protein
MPSKSYNRGAEFEDEIREILVALRAKHPKRVRVHDHPRIRLHDRQEVIPDFVLEYGMPEARHVVTIECQSRRRSQKDIANKIRAIKALSDRNRFFFVYRDSLPKATRKALEADGTTIFSFDEFVFHVECLASSLKHTNEIFKSSKVARKLRGFKEVGCKSA